MERAVVTQAILQPVQFALNEVAANLAAHANASLSQAHGINLLYVAPGTLDANGNDISKYRDDHGDVIGDFFVMFTLGNQIYFAPANSSALPGQALNTGKGSYDGNPLITSGKGTAWITDVITQDVAVVDSIDNDVLLAHSSEGYWETHGSMVAVAKPVYDSIGHLIGNYVVQFTFNSISYEIPCDKRLGGPAQGIQVTFDKASPIRINGAGDGTYNISITPVITGGTGPFTFGYEYYQAGGFTGNTIAPTAYPPGVNVPWVNPAGTAGLLCAWTAATGVFTIVRGGPGGDSYDFIRIRLTVTGPGGSTHVDATGKDLVFEFQVQDSAPCCWFCSEAHKQARIADQDWKIMGCIEQEIFKFAPRLVAAYIKHGDRLVQRMNSQGVTPDYYVEFSQAILRIAAKDGLKAAAEVYAKTVVDNVIRYWPETQERGFAHYLRRLKSDH